MIKKNTEDGASAPRFSGLYQLDIPNKEVRIGLMRSLLPNYVQRPAELNTLVAEKIIMAIWTTL